MKNNNSLALCLFMAIYLLVWIIALPFLLFVKRLRPITWHRFGMGMPQGPFDLWIQAASVGEAKLALKLLSDLPEEKYPRIIISVNTAQGMDVLKNMSAGRAELVFFPLDILPAWSMALARVQPRKMLLLETEIWPGLLYICRQKSIPVTIGNARMSLKSFCRYSPFSTLLKQMSPRKIVAVSEREKERFSWIFESAETTLMRNIKFDIIENSDPVPYIKNPLSQYFKAGHPLIVLGSVRKEEETYLQWLVKEILSQRPKSTIALFPRHLNRIESWEMFLEKGNFSWISRTKLDTNTSLPGVILWDKFGELIPAYALARSVFVGGSLVPCGGQNFLEPLSQGVVPCIGPYWDNFNWVGREILSSSLINQVADVHELLDKLIKPPPTNREKVLSDFRKYVAERNGGTSQLIRQLS